jgi:hypothetical protein
VPSLVQAAAHVQQIYLGRLAGVLEALVAVARLLRLDHRGEIRVFAHRIQSVYSEVVRPKMDSSGDPRYNFSASPTVDELIAQQGKSPVHDPQVLLGDFWPEDEPVEKFLTALGEWRGHDRSDRAA